MSHVHVVAHLRAKPEHIDRVTAAFEDLVIATRAELGCLQYDLLSDKKDPCHFVFVEIWESVESQQAHLDTDHLAGFVLACKGALAEATVYELDQRL